MYLPCKSGVHTCTRVCSVHVYAIFGLFALALTGKRHIRGVHACTVHAHTARIFCVTFYVRFPFPRTSYRYYRTVEASRLLRMPDALLSVIPPEVCNLAPWDFSLHTGMKPWVLKYFETYNRKLTNWSAICVKCHWGKPKAPDDEPSFKSTSTMQMHFMRNFEGLAMCKPCKPCSWSPEEMKVEDPEFYAKVLALVNKEIDKATSKDTTSTTPVSISCTSTLSGKKHGRDDGEGSPRRQVCTPKRPRHSTLVECTPSPCASELPFLIVCSPAKSTTSSLSVEWGEG